jgi:excisionase family DNA binding protein
MSHPPITSPLDLSAVAREFGLTEALYPVIEAAKKLGVSRAFVYELIASGDLELLHIGAKPLIPAPSIARLIQRRREAAQAKRAVPQAQKTPVRRSGRRS